MNVAKNKRKRKRRKRNVSGSVYWLIMGSFVMCFAQEYPGGEFNTRIEEARRGGAEGKEVEGIGNRK